MSVDLISQWTARRHLRPISCGVLVVRICEVGAGAFGKQRSKSRLARPAHAHQRNRERPRAYRHMDFAVLYGFVVLFSWA